MILLTTSSISAQLPEVCQSAENILVNCTFDSGLDNWQTFTEDGGANISVLQGGGECHAPLCPAAYIVTEGHFVGGLMQQVAVTPGNTYYANVIWLVFDSLVNDDGINSNVGGIGRKIGIDPTGGTDSRSPNVVWSEDNWRNDCKICGVEHVTATAQAEVITVFLRLDDTWRRRAAEKGFSIPPSKDQFWIDDIGLKLVAEGEAGALPVPTETPPPAPTETPAPGQGQTTEPAAPAQALAVADTDQTATTPEEEAPAPEVEASPTPLQQEMEEAPQTPEATATPDVVGTVAPPPTLTPTNTPEPTATLVAQQLRPLATPVPPVRRERAVPETTTEAALFSSGIVGLAGTTACIGGGVLIVLMVIFGSVTWLYRLGWGKIDDTDDDAYEYNEDDGYDDGVDIEIVE